MTRREASGAAISDVVRLAIAARLATLHVAFPARVEAYDASTNSVDVQPQLEMEIERGDGSSLRDPLPIVCGVPIAWPRSRTYGMSFPLEVGDFVLVVVADRNLGEWLRTGEAGDPRDVGSHVLDGAVAIPGLYPEPDALGAEHLTDHLVLGRLASGGAALHVRPSELRLVSDSAEQASVRGTAQRDALHDLIDALDAWADAVDTGVTAAGGSIGPAHATFLVALATAKLALDNALTTAVKVP